jgi:hypothetical protein
VSSLEELLSRRQRNDLYRVIERSDLPASEFGLAVGARGDIVIEHLPSKSWLGIHGLKPLFADVYVYGDIGDPEELVKEHRNQNFVTVMERNEACPWPDMLPLVEKWAAAVHWQMEGYANNPDFWAELDRSKKFLTAKYENSPFSESEQAEISGQIQQLKAYIKATYELTAEQIAEVDEKLDQAEQASRHIGRKDWLMLFNGAVFSLILTDVMPAQAAQNILVMTLQGLGHLFGIGGPVLQLP